MLKHYDFRDYLTVRRFILYQVDDCLTNRRHVALKNASVNLLVRAETNTFTAFQCSISQKIVPKVCGENMNANHFDIDKIFKRAHSLLIKLSI